MGDYLHLRQICLVAPVLAPAVAAIEQVLGLAVCYRDPLVAHYGLENALFPIGTTLLEVVAPIRPDTAAERFLARSEGRGAYMVIFDCSDPDRRAARAQSLGVRIASTHTLEAFHGFQLHPKDCGAAMLEFDRTEGAEDPMGPYGPAGGAVWTRAIRTDLTRRLTAIRVESPAPDDLVRHWSQLLEVSTSGRRLATLPVGIEVTEAPPGTREAVTALVLDVADPHRVRAAAREHGLALDGDAPVICGVRLELRGA